MEKKEISDNIEEILTEDKDMSINDVDSITEGILYFLKYILPKHFIKIIITAIVFALIVTGYNCKTKWFEFNKQPIRTKVVSQKTQ